MKGPSTDANCRARSRGAFALCRKHRARLRGSKSRRPAPESGNRRLGERARKRIALSALVFLTPTAALAAGGGVHPITGLAASVQGYLGLFLFALAFGLVPFENSLHLRKSKPVLVAAGVIWILVALAYRRLGQSAVAREAIQESLIEYAELFLFLLSAMTYINALEERNVFQVLRGWLVSRGFSLRVVFWVTGLLAFVISPVADNLTTALLMGAVVMAVDGDNRKFTTLACINIVVAANAGGAFSPFGDITTLMVWQEKKVAFHQFFSLLIPALANWLVPALIMHFAVGNGPPRAVKERVRLKFGAVTMVLLFFATIATAVAFHGILGLPAAVGMMLGLGYLGMFSFFIKHREGLKNRYDDILGARRRNETGHSFNSMQGKAVAEIAAMIEEMPVAAFMIDKNHEIILWNAPMARLTGVPAEARVGTRDQWKSFYDHPRPVLCDLVIDSKPDVQISRFYAGKHQVNNLIESAYDASDFFPGIGEEGRWLSFAAAPVKDRNGRIVGAVEIIEEIGEVKRQQKHFDLMERISRVEWDTLLFFYGVILCVGGLAQFGYLSMVSHVLYTGMGNTIANTLVGGLSAIVDNIPVMFAVLTMNPHLSAGQWLLVTLTAGTGGSLLSVGSAAGVALMGSARGVYTFGAHLKWTPVIALGYAAAIWLHLVLNAGLM